MPEDFEDGQSPIEGLKEVDWSGVDAELEEFMASGSESDSESVASSKLFLPSNDGQSHPR